MAQAVDEDDSDDESDDDGSLDEDPLASDQDPREADDVEESIRCPFCKKPIHENADVCNHCGNFVGGADAPRHLPVLIWVGVTLAALCVLVWIFG